MSEVEDVFVGEEAELPKKVKWDMRPTQEEVNLHNTTHLPYRSWCPHCVGEKARRGNHRRRMRRLRSTIPVISVDHMWMKGQRGDSEEEVKGNAVLVAHCRETKITWGRVVLKQGGGPG